VILFEPCAFGQSVKEVQSAAFDRPPGTAAARESAVNLAGAKEAILSSTNALRRQQGRPELKLNQQLANTAQSFAEYMAQTDKYSHTADGKEPWERAAQHGYAYCIILENIAYDYSPEGFRTKDLAQSLMKGWKNSPPHRKNLLDPDVSDIGVGLAYSSRTGRYYAVQVFGRPKSKQITFKITNDTNSTVHYTVDGKEFSIEPRYTITYEECRPPELRLSSAPTSTALHPSNGSHYVIRKNESGKLTIERKKQK
jgi:uncharacterized protein YkwD